MARRYSRNEAMDQHITNIIRKRQTEKPHLLPQVAFSTIDKDRFAKGRKIDYSHWMSLDYDFCDRTVRAGA